MNGKKNEIQTASAKLPRGLADRPPSEIAATEKMLAVIKETYELYGFEAVETPLIEFTEALGKFLPDQDRPNEGVFSFKDIAGDLSQQRDRSDENWLSLRYDLTAPLARYVAENFDKLPKPYRSYRAGYVFRNEKPGPGRFRQFMQFDADTVGASSVAADAEMCMMAADTLERLGIKRGDYVIKVNNRKVLDGVMEAIGLGGEENAGRRLTVLRAIDKVDRLGWEGVEQLLGLGRTDDSGDFAKGAGLTPGDVKVLGEYLFVRRSEHLERIKHGQYIPGDEEIRTIAGEKAYYYSSLTEIQVLSDYVGIGNSQVGQDAINELEQMFKFLSEAGYGSRRVRFDPSV
ncbi:MAG: ATP phosphoribosyltransferase regulatory subunit, partial [Methylocella sp.]